MCSSRPRQNTPAPPPPPPERTDSAVVAAGDRERSRIRRQQGQQSTILTGPAGAPNYGATAQVKTLLGS